MTWRPCRWQYRRGTTAAAAASQCRCPRWDMPASALRPANTFLSLSAATVSPLPQTAAANEQHYEVPTEYFLAALGPHRKVCSHKCVCSVMQR